jgi:hypothetical protein
MAGSSASGRISRRKVSAARRLARRVAAGVAVASGFVAEGEPDGARARSASGYVSAAVGEDVELSMRVR